MGPFFSQFAAYLRSHGSHVWKINFNGGDWLYSRGQNVVNYLGTVEAWPQFLAQMIADQRIDQLFLFGDCRSYHRDAIKVAREAGIRVFVFEEGVCAPPLHHTGRRGRQRIFLLVARSAFLPWPAPCNTGSECAAFRYQLFAHGASSDALLSGWRLLAALVLEL